MLTVTNNRMADKKVKKDDDVTVYGTDKSRFLETGKAYKVNRVLGETLVKSGQATASKPADKSGDKKDDK